MSCDPDDTEPDTTGLDVIRDLGWAMVGLAVKVGWLFFAAYIVAYAVRCAWN